jgi:hypothetical protein
MRFQQALRYTVANANPESLEKFARFIPATWIGVALGVCGKATVRRRRLPAELVVWLVVGMGLFRDRSIVELVEALGLVLPGGDGSKDVAPSAVSNARARLGPEPVKWLFEATGHHWAGEAAQAHRWCGLTLFGMDGSTLRVADSQENRSHFGGTKTPRGHSGYPLLRVVVLMALRSHLLLAAAFGPSTTSEMAYAVSLMKQIPDHSLSILDRAYLGASFLHSLMSMGKNRHWLTRTKKDTRLTVTKTLGKNDHIVEMVVSEAARRKDPALPATLTLRRIRYQVRGFRPQGLLTSLLDPRQYPATQVIGLYHERWELELGYDEVKTEMLEREEALRSQTPGGVMQEVWGVLLAYNLIRRYMEHVADQLKVEPTAISFVAALHLIRDEFIWLAATSPGAIPARLNVLERSLSRMVLPARRSARRYPRAVKLKMSKFPRKRPVTTGRTA